MIEQIYNYFTISFIRNPYERLVACYLEFKEKQCKNKVILGPKNFKQFVDFYIFFRISLFIHTKEHIK